MDCPFSSPHQQHQLFQQRKEALLSPLRPDKSSAGEIDSRAVPICSALNLQSEYCTTSSCSGRSFLYAGQGNKSGGSVRGASFKRGRVSHEQIQSPEEYFDLKTVEFEGWWQDDTSDVNHDNSIWLRYEPFILHVLCESLEAAHTLMACARPSFKNVGLTYWSGTHNIDNTYKINNQYNDGTGSTNQCAKNEYSTNSDDDISEYDYYNHQSNDDWRERVNGTNNQQQQQQLKKYLVAIWGEDGLDMPLSLPSSPTTGIFYDSAFSERNHADTTENAVWLAQLVNERHARNWSKMERFLTAIQNSIISANSEQTSVGFKLQTQQDFQGGNYLSRVSLPIPKSYDVIGDVAVLNSLPEEWGENVSKSVGDWILSRNRGVKICIARTHSLSSHHRTPGANGLIQLSGPSRHPLLTTHSEHGIKCVIDLHHTFFSLRMAPERSRLLSKITSNEHVLVVFAGVGMEALQIVARTMAAQVTTIEENPVAVECLRRGKRMLERNSVARKGAVERLCILEGDAHEVLPTLDRGSFDRIVAPRPKENVGEGDLEEGNLAAGSSFLLVMLPLLNVQGGILHWYDFVADHELPSCDRTKNIVEGVCRQVGLELEVLCVSKVGSVAKRQFRVCVDFRILQQRQGAN